MKPWKHMLAVLTAAAILTVSALPVAAAGETAQFDATPDTTQISTGDTVTLSVRCTQADLDPAAAVLTFAVGENYVFTEARTGADISLGELSYSYQNGQLVLLYLDNAGGGSPLAAGGEMATITLQAASAAEGEPMTCTETDVSAVGADGNAISLQGSTQVGSVTVTGDPVEVMTPAPVVVDEGVEQDAQAILQSQAASDSSGTTEPSGSQPASSAAATTGNAAGDSAAQSGASPAPTPFYTTSPSGERIEIWPEPSTEPVDRTQEVLDGQPATAPDSSADTDAGPSVLPLVLTGLAVVVVATVGLLVYTGALRRKKKRK